MIMEEEMATRNFRGAFCTRGKQERQRRACSIVRKTRFTVDSPNVNWFDEALLRLACHGERKRERGEECEPN